MSGSKNRKQRKNQRDSGFDLSNQKDREAEQARRKQTRTTVIVLIAIAVVSVVVLFLNSGLFYRSMTALNVDGQRFSIADMNFYLALVAPEGGEEEAIEAAVRSTMLHRRAVEEGLELDEAAWAQINMSLDEIISAAEFHGVSVGQFLAFNYGRGVNLRLIERRLEFESLGGMYETLYQERLHGTYSEAELEAYYMEHRDEYDRVLFRVFDLTFDATGEGGLAMEDAVEIAEALYEATLGTLPLGIEPAPEPAAVEEADESEYETPVTLPAEIDDEDEDADEAEAEDADDDEPEDEPEVEAPAAAAPVDDSAEAREARFLDAVSEMRDDAEAQTLRNQTRAEAGFWEYADWLLDDNRQPGDVTVFEGSDTISVLYFVGTDDNRFHAANVRHILIRPEEVDFFDEEGELLEAFQGEDGEFDELLIMAAQEEVHAAAEERAEEILAEWRTDGATEEAFIALVREYSEDNWQMNRSPGLFEEIGRNSPLVPEFLAWSIDEARQPGDAGVVGTQFGAHVMYFVGWNEELYHRHALAQWDKAAEDYQAWVEEAVEGFDGHATFFFRLTETAFGAMQPPAMW